MTNTPISVLVTLATGKQGFQVIKALSQHNKDGKKIFLIIGVTRDVTSIKSKKLLTFPGVELIQGDINSDQAASNIFISAVNKAQAHLLKKLDAAFLAQQGPDNPEGLYDGEIKQGKRFVDLTVKHQVSHLVYSSIAACQEDDDTGVIYFESKRVIERYIKDTCSDTWTILQPAGFMENLTKSEDGMQLFTNTFVTAILTSPLQWVSCLDIGRFTARALLDPKNYAGKSIALAGELLSPNDIMTKWSMAGLGEFKTIPVESVRQQVEQVDFMVRMAKFVNTVGYKVNIAALRHNYPDLMDFETFLKYEVE